MGLSWRPWIEKTVHGGKTLTLRKKILDAVVVQKMFGNMKKMPLLRVHYIANSLGNISPYLLIDPHDIHDQILDLYPA